MRGWTDGKRCGTTHDGGAPSLCDRTGCVYWFAARCTVRITKTWTIWLMVRTMLALLPCSHPGVGFAREQMVECCGACFAVAEVGFVNGS
jgi:hypothetical protein